MPKHPTSRVRRAPLKDVYDTLFATWGPQHWWPGQTRLEIMVGAILTQNTAWANVEKAIRNLKKAHALNLNSLRSASHDQLADWIRPAGYFNVKATRLKNLIAAIDARFEGRLGRMFAADTEDLRKWLLDINGIGEETADSILLYAGKRPVFVVDAYTRRMLFRHRWIVENASYEHIAQLMVKGLPKRVQLYNEYHALIVQLGKEHCRPKPRCSKCPLRPRLPQNGNK